MPENITLPNDLVEKIKKRIEGTEFKTVSEYVSYVLQEVLSDDDEDEDDSFSEEDEEKVKERLRSLGYLD